MLIIISLIYKYIDNLICINDCSCVIVQIIFVSFFYSHVNVPEPRRSGSNKIAQQQEQGEDNDQSAVNVL